MKVIYNYIESALKDNSELIFSTGEDIKTRDFKVYEKEYNFTWTAALGDASGTMVGCASRKGDTYSLTFKYCLTDFYDWDENGDIAFINFGPTDGEIFQFHKGIR